MQSVTENPVFPLWTAAPFVLLLISIAVVPLLAPRWWERNSSKLIVSVAASAPILAVLLPAGVGLLADSLLDYFSFIVLLAALFVISGGISIRSGFAGTPLVNSGFLIVGAVLANLIGTTGASLLLIRPYLQANHARKRKTHLVVFYIFIVSNIGGLLTPLGDPPLFLGFLRGVPFQWTLTLFPIWAAALVLILIIFNLYDRYVLSRQDVDISTTAPTNIRPRRRLHVEGKRNFLFLFGVMAMALLSGHFGWRRGIQEGAMIALSLLSWVATPRTVHKANHFRFHPILEIASLFAGIFVTVIPVMEILHDRAAALNLQAPWQYFWLSGMLSSFLDNAPTYLAFTAMASGVAGTSSANLGELLNSSLGVSLLRAVSVGAVFMGANCYIGNGPNFMVKNIAEHHGVEMPSFGGYMLYSGLVLIPVFAIVTLIFFR